MFLSTCTVHEIIHVHHEQCIAPWGIVHTYTRCNMYGVTFFFFKEFQFEIKDQSMETEKKVGLLRGTCCPPGDLSSARTGLT